MFPRVFLPLPAGSEIGFTSHPFLNNMNIPFCIVILLILLYLLCGCSNVQPVVDYTVPARVQPQLDSDRHWPRNRDKWMIQTGF